MRVEEAKECHPINAIGGFYVSIEGSNQDVYGMAAGQLAIRTAEEHGWKGHGKATVGMPCKKGVFTYTKAFWFHERK